MRTPWQSVGAKAVVNLSAKLGLALLPPQTTFFKLQIRDDKLGEEIPAEIRSELDLSFSKMERMDEDPDVWERVPRFCFPVTWSRMI